MGFVMYGCVCVCGFCNVWVCVCVGFIMCECVYVWVLYCVGVCMCGFYNVWVFWQRVLAFTAFCIVCTVFFGIVLFMCMFSYLFCLYCHRVTTQLQLVS
jgi:hypothetical protein